jgi:hypothetical protein
VSQVSTDGSDVDRVVLNAGNGNASAGAASPGGDAGGSRRLTSQQKKILAVALVVHAIVATFTWRDLRRRPAAAVRGPKLLWGVWATLNTSGSLAYWLFGRRHTPEA